MEEKKYCPICGHEFVQGESNYNYETAYTDYHCPDCDWEGTYEQVLDEDTIISDLVDAIDNEGIEVTSEDANNVISELAYHDSYEEAVQYVAKGIVECLY